MDQQLFDTGIAFDDYIGGLRNYRRFVKERTEEVSVSDETVSQAKRAIDDLASPVCATVMTEDWCGDSACNLPAVNRLLTESGVALRIFRAGETPQLNDWYNSIGVTHIPVLSLWDSSWNEVGRWVEAPQSISAKKDTWKSENPQFMELYRRRNDDNAAATEFAKLYRVFMDQMAEWYRNGGWNDVYDEVIASLTRAAG